MTRKDLHEFIAAHRWAVEATTATSGRPQAAVIGFVVSEALELFFDTLTSARKYANLRASPQIALVIGWDEGCTVQYEGIADEPSGAELARWKALYFARFPDGREREALPDIAYIRVKPLWLRFSDFRTTPPLIIERRRDEL
ncbi:MAG TPA: pyridoxamine 5'-phosphate oxidase family protein [Xanthobacteraceae bacterium]|nr:pyridoxamine 5'-phosphate oxidase family protein [Xanthobacteraceae bacterium]